MEKIAVVDFVHLTITYEEEPNMKVATDIGGTFTDLVAIDENGSLILEKAHTTPPNFFLRIFGEKAAMDAFLRRISS